MQLVRTVNISFILLFTLQSIRRLLSFQTGRQPLQGGSDCDLQTILPCNNSPASSDELNVTSTKVELSRFLDGDTPTSDIPHLLDFIVAGFAKCGTTTLETWLGQQPQIQMQRGEQYHYAHPIETVVRELHDNLPQGWNESSSVRKGFHCPHHVQTKRGFSFTRNYFPNAKMIVVVRNPVLWFESLYNYRLEQNELDLLKGTPNELIGELSCKKCSNPKYISTATGTFHQYMARLGKTKLQDPDELRLLEPFVRDLSELQDVTKTSNSIFFLETSQLGDNNRSRSTEFRSDLQGFLDLEEELLPQTPRVRPPWNKKNKGKASNFTRINICDKQFIPVKEEMLQISRNASLWFRDFFLGSEDVVVSSRPFLIEILESWTVDPCIQRSQKKRKLMLRARQGRA